MFINTNLLTLKILFRHFMKRKRIIYNTLISTLKILITGGFFKNGS